MGCLSTCPSPSRGTKPCCCPLMPMPRTSLRSTLARAVSMAAKPPCAAACLPVAPYTRFLREQSCPGSLNTFCDSLPSGTLCNHAACPAQMYRHACQSGAHLDPQRRVLLCATWHVGFNDIVLVRAPRNHAFALRVIHYSLGALGSHIQADEEPCHGSSGGDRHSRSIDDQR